MLDIGACQLPRPCVQSSHITGSLNRRYRNLNVPASWSWLLCAFSLVCCCAKRGEEHISIRYSAGTGNYHLDYIDAQFDYIKLAEPFQTPTVPLSSRVNVLPGQGPFEEIAPFPTYPWGCGRRPDGTEASAWVSIALLCSHDTHCTYVHVHMQCMDRSIVSNRAS